MLGTASMNMHIMTLHLDTEDLNFVVTQGAFILPKFIHLWDLTGGGP